MVRANSDPDQPGHNDGDALDVERLRMAVELQEARVRVLEQRKAARDRLLHDLRATLTDARPEGLGDIGAAALGAEPQGTSGADGADVRVVFSSPLEVQLAAEQEAPVGTAGHATVDDFLADNDATNTNNEKKKSRRGKGKKAAAQQSQLQHVDPAVASPEGFDFTKGKAINVRVAAEEEAHMERMCALLDDFVERMGPIMPAASTDAEPAWLGETADTEATEPAVGDTPGNEKENPTAAACVGASDDAYSDDFEDFEAEEAHPATEAD